MQLNFVIRGGVLYVTPSLASKDVLIYSLITYQTVYHLVNELDEMFSTVSIKILDSMLPNIAVRQTFY